MGGIVTIDAVSRCLTVLRNLNAFNGVTVSELARLSQMTRASTNRYLVTLMRLGYVERSDHTRRYSVTEKVLEFSEGIPPDDWIMTIVRPELVKTCRDIGWPLSFSTIRGSRVAILENTDAESPLIVSPMREHMMIPLVGRASGHTLLAHKPKNVYSDLLFIAQNQDSNLFSRAHYTREQFEDVLRDSRESGYATAKIPGVNWAALSVPVWLHGSVDFSVSIRFHPTAISIDEATSRFLVPLRECSMTLTQTLDANDLEIH